MSTPSCLSATQGPTNSLYTPLDKATRQIRLIGLKDSSSSLQVLEFDLGIFDLESAPPFMALSYVWGNPTAPKNISLGGQLTGRNRQKSSNEHPSHRLPLIPHYLWVDALCINQADLDEKSSQIPMMYDIYERAQHVIMWLGEETASSQEAMSLVLQCDPFNPTRWNALSSLIERPYWGRVWIVQEIVSASSALV
ncbi:heterokaryon incompatibility protein-domain-containing protein, partial [Tricladium varicosporioides]